MQQTGRPDRTGYAIFMVLLGTFIISSSDLVTKWLTSGISLWQLQFMRSAIGMVLLLALLFVLRKLSAIKVINSKAILIRSLIMTGSYLTFFTALAVAPIALVAGAYFSAPIFMVILSRFMLKETLGVWRMISVLSGFIGVLLILQPTSSQFDPVLILPLICAFLYALTQVYTRKYCKDENPLAISYWMTVAFMISGLIGLIITWLLPVPAETGFLTRPAAILPIIPTLVIVALAAGSLIMHLALASAYQNAPASLVAPLEYLYLPITIFGGYFFFDEIPKPNALIGIAIIITAGLIIAWRERALSRIAPVTQQIETH